jgi:hypothetical protein
MMTMQPNKMKSEKHQTSPVASAFHEELRTILDEVPRLVVTDPYDPTPETNDKDLMRLAHQLCGLIANVNGYQWAVVIVRRTHPENN